MKKLAVENELRRELVVGGFAFAVVVGLFLFSLFVTGGVLWSSKQPVVAEFGDVMGLRDGDNVVLRGMTVGEVKRLEFHSERGRVRVYCQLDVPVALTENCTARIVSTSVLGGRYLELDEGDASGKLGKDAVIPGQDPTDLMDDAAAIFADVRKALNKDGGGLEDMNAIVSDMREIASKINDGQGTLGKLVNDDTLYNDIASAVADLKDVSSRLEQGEGMIGKLLDEDDPMYEETKLLMEDIRAAVDDFRETAPVLTFTSVFFGAF